MSFKRNASKSFLHYCCKFSVFFNILTFVFGASYFIVSTYSVLLDLFGVILIFSWALNILILYLDDRFLVKTHPIGRKINHFTYYFIVFFIAGFILIVIGNFFLSILTEGESSFFGLTVDMYIFGTIVIYVDILIGLLGIAILGIYLAILTFSNLDSRGAFNFE